MILEFKKYGSVLGGRDLAAKIREQVEQCSSEVVFNFENVRTVSHSFADELIGKLAAKYGAAEFKRKIKVINLSEVNRSVFSFVINDRVSTTELA